jgi:dihydrofolate reductase
VKVSYYVAASLDGFIAGPDGDVDWLEVAHLPGEDFGYAGFVESVDALIMGRKTWDFVADVRPWPYGSRPVRVFSHRSIDPGELPVERATGEPSRVVAELAEGGHEHVWLVGGGGLASALVESGDLTDLILTVIPVTLGRGIPLFGDDHDQTVWHPRPTRRWSNGVVQHHLGRDPGR